MDSHRARRRGLLTTVLRLLAAVALLACALALLAPAARHPAASVTASPDPVPVVTAPTPAPVVARSAGTSDTAEPVRVRVPAIGVDSPLDRLGTDPAGALVPPTDFDRAGWFTGGASPGDVGPAVIAGHVDSVSGPAVFARLGDLAPGDEVLVDRGDGTTAGFRVTAVEQYPKADFPTAAVYGPTPRAELRLITCGGDFDRTRRSYTDNVVVTAVLTWRNGLSVPP